MLTHLEIIKFLTACIILNNFSLIIQGICFTSKLAILVCSSCYLIILILLIFCILSRILELWCLTVVPEILMTWIAHCVEHHSGTCGSRWDCLHALQLEVFLRLECKYVIPHKQPRRWHASAALLPIGEVERVVAADRGLIISIIAFSIQSGALLLSHQVDTH